VIAVGTWRGAFGNDFAIVHGTGRADVVELDGASYSRLIVTTREAGSAAGDIQQRLMLSSTLCHRQPDIGRGRDEERAPRIAGPA